MSLPEPTSGALGPRPDGRHSDEELAAAVLDGDGEAFAEIFRRYGPRIRRFVASRADGDAARREELLQEVFFQLYRSLPRFAGRSRFRTWLYGLAHNVCRHERRRRGRRPEPLGDGGEDASLEAIPDLAPDVTERLAAGEERRRVRREVDRLPAIYREVLVLRDWEDLSYAEIAGVLEIPVGTVRSRLHQARARLAGALRDLMDGER